MFRKKQLTTIAAAILGLSAIVSSNAQAVTLSEDGLGQVLIFPYYNVNQGFQTQINVLNKTNSFKAIKVRFRESRNSFDVIDFNVYLSPWDVWTGTVVKKPVQLAGELIPKDRAVLLSSDRTCTYPTFPTEGVVFKDDVYDVTTVEDAREGYLEVIEMGILDADGNPLTNNGVDITPNSSGIYYPQVDKTGLYSPGSDDVILRDGRSVSLGILHNAANKTPNDCSVIATAWAEGTFTEGGAVINTTAGSAPVIDNVPRNVGTPTGGLAGVSVLLNTQTGSAYVVDPTAVSNYAAFSAPLTLDKSKTYQVQSEKITLLPTNAINNGDPTNHTGNGAQHYRSDNPRTFLLPSYASGNVNTSEVVDDDGDDIIITRWNSTSVDCGMYMDMAGLKSTNSGVNPFPLAHALAATGVSNNYFIDPIHNGATDWVVTFPMRKHCLFGSTRYDVSAPDSVTPVANPAYSKVGFGDFVPTGADVQFDVSFWGREEQQPIVNITDPGFSPPKPIVDNADAFLREVNIRQFKAESRGVPVSSVLGSDHAIDYTIEDGFSLGWADFLFPRYNLNDSALFASFMYNATDPVNISYAGSSFGAVRNPSYAGIPVISFAAIRGTVVPAGTVGEVVPANIYRDRGTAE